jgi:transglutaminase-like putative cysteine protease
MILEVQHETRLTYSAPVVESVTEVRMEATSDHNQSVRSFHLSVSPSTDVFRFVDGFGNHVHHFNLLPSCQEIRIVAAAVVETHPQARQSAASSATHPLIEEQISLPARSFLSLGGPVRYTPRLDSLVDQLRPTPGMPLVDAVMRIAGHIRENFTYAKDVTLASSPIDDVLREGKGVCQDFTHLMIALVRSFGIPARYVSGYIHRPNNESQSHAWCEVWLPDSGWFGIDPTNNRQPDDHFVKVAIGRDFTDVPPNKGMYRGKAVEEIFVRVETRALDQLPSLSWQEIMPTFAVPFTAITSASRHDQAEGGESQQ